MFKRKLQALKYHNPENFNWKDDGQFKSAVAWLEDQHIRHYKIEDRENLRNVKSPEWDNYFEQYLSELQCPINKSEKTGVFDWLLGWAVHLKYEENNGNLVLPSCQRIATNLTNHPPTQKDGFLKLEQVYKEKTAANLEKNVSASPHIVAENPLDNLSFESDEFKTGVNELAKLLNVTKHPDHLVTLKAISQLVKAKLSSEVLKSPNDHMIGGKPFPLQECDLGFETGDYVLNQAAKILRLLFIRDQRDLQTRINEVIVAVQAITANPKTDSSLGKVGV